ncbi:hypothetical protein GCM10027160_09920 [Streptomyces calidiresistens]|uniref:GNAT family N-acetyltransferase n=1 Tax=Streptomyces calidiresistens TaxID=1485586 RepID=A0A7W3T0Z6_9ACTN|nr:hypothetical protein [Streptomyces calidiresistens]MBB0228974.1 hypothetical protein [Streptomyces calidiresistens]
MEFGTELLRVRAAGQGDDPAEFLPLFNTNPEFLDANTLRTGVREFTEEDIARYLWQGEVTENSRCLAARTREGDRLVGTVSLLAPHPGEGQPWIGLLLIDGRLDHDRWAGDLLAGLEGALAGEGWRTVYVGPLVELRESVAWWRSRGYVPVEERRDNDKRLVEVHRRELASPSA